MHPLFARPWGSARIVQAWAIWWHYCLAHGAILCSAGLGDFVLLAFVPSNWSLV